MKLTDEQIEEIIRQTNRFDSDYDAIEDPIGLIRIYNHDTHNCLCYIYNNEVYLPSGIELDRAIETLYNAFNGIRIVMNDVILIVAEFLEGFVKQFTKECEEDNEQNGL